MRIWEFANTDVMELKPEEKDRLEMLFCMNYEITSLNDEDAYFRWIYTFPDEANIYDYIDIAMDEKAFAECMETYEKIRERYKKDGFFIGKKVYAF